MSKSKPLFFGPSTRHIFEREYGPHEPPPREFPLVPGATMEDRLEWFICWWALFASSHRPTFQQIGSAIGVTRQAVQQIQESALRKSRKLRYISAKCDERNGPVTALLSDKTFVQALQSELE